MVHRQAAAGHDIVDMRMALERLPPRVQNTEEANFGPRRAGLAATSSSVAALASNRSAKRSFWFCQINGTSTCGTVKTRWK